MWYRNREFRKTLTTAGNSPGKEFLISKMLSGLGASHTHRDQQHLVTAVCAIPRCPEGTQPGTGGCRDRAVPGWHSKGGTAAVCWQPVASQAAGEALGVAGLGSLLLQLQGIPGSCVTSGSATTSWHSAGHSCSPGQWPVMALARPPVPRGGW